MQPARHRRRARLGQAERWGSRSMRLRTVVRRSGVTLAALGLVLAGRLSTHLNLGGHPAAEGHLSSRTVLSRAAPASNVEAAPSGAPSSASSGAPSSGPSDARLSATAQPNGGIAGVLVIRVPPFAPELCSPAHITVNVGQMTMVACRSANYGGPIAASVSNPAVASVSTSGGFLLPRYLYVIGKEPGTTIVQVSYQHGPTTFYSITVSPA